MRPRVPASLAGVLLAGLLAAPAAGAGCAGVRRSGGWTMTDVPLTPVEGTDRNAYDTTRLLSYAEPLLAAGGVPGRWFASDGVSVFRSTDSACTWQRVYTLEPTALAASAADATGAAPAADVEYKVTSLATPVLAPGAKVAGSTDVVYALLSNGDGFTGLAMNEASLTPFFLARSVDGGRTWRTDVFAAPLPGATVATPVVGDGFTDARVVMSPADARTAYVSVLTPYDPRTVSTERTDVSGVYVTRDAGATWSFAAPQVLKVPIVPDARDPATYYGSDGLVVEAVTVGPAPARKPLLTLPSSKSERVVMLDTVRDKGRPARLLALTRRHDTTLAIDIYRLYRSADGGRTWSATDIPFYGLGPVHHLSAWLTPSGDADTVRSIGGFLATSTIAQRWTVARTWQKGRLQKVPRGGSAAGTRLMGVGAVDSGHRMLTVRGVDEAQGGDTYVVGVVDQRSW